MSGVTVEEYATLDDAIATLVLAFSTEPGTRWLYPDARRFTVAFPELLRISGGPAARAGTIDLGADGVAAALWVPPGSVADEVEEQLLLERTVEPWRRPAVTELHAALAAVRPVEPHWYLLAIGVDPCHRGQGRGTALLRAGLERCDGTGHAAYLESADPRNRVLYERHGFEVLDEIQVADSPPVWPMLRPVSSLPERRSG